MVKYVVCTYRLGIDYIVHTVVLYTTVNQIYQLGECMIVENVQMLVNVTKKTARSGCIAIK